MRSDLDCGHGVATCPICGQTYGVQRFVKGSVDWARFYLSKPGKRPEGVEQPRPDPPMPEKPVEVFVPPSKQEHWEASGRGVDMCPDCKNFTLVLTGGCALCYDCGFSRC